MEILELTMKVLGVLTVVGGLLIVPYKILIMREIKSIEDQINKSLAQSSPVEVMLLRLTYVEKEMSDHNKQLTEIENVMGSMKYNYINRFSDINEKAAATEGRLLDAIYQIKNKP